MLPPLVSIVIVSYNVASIMRDCLMSIRRETTIPFEIIVIDNASGDTSCQMIEEEFPDVLLIKNTTNQGFAKANNQGLAIARGEFTLFLNPDTIILRNAIDVLAHILMKNPNIGMLGPHTYNADGNTTQATALRQPTLMRAFHLHIPIWRVVPFWKPIVLGEYVPSGTEDVEIVKGSCMLMRTSEAREIGGMNEAYFMYSEEIDLCEAVRKSGKRVVYTTEASIIHLGGASTTAVSEEMAVHLLRSLKKFFERKYSSSPAALQILRFLLLFGSAWRFCAWSIVAVLQSKHGDNSKEIRGKRRNHQAMMRWLWCDFS